MPRRRRMSPESTQALCRETLAGAPAWEAALHLHRTVALGGLGEASATLSAGGAGRHLRVEVRLRHGPSAAHLRLQAEARAGLLPLGFHLEEGGTSLLLGGRRPPAHETLDLYTLAFADGAALQPTLAVLHALLDALALRAAPSPSQETTPAWQHA